MIFLLFNLYVFYSSINLVSSEYARIRKEYNADAWLYGTTTTKEFTNQQKPTLKENVIVDDGDFIVNNHALLYYVSIDINGEVGWNSGTFKKEGRPDAHVIEVLTEKTSSAYKAYLREKGVSYILAGVETLNCKLASEKLYNLFGIHKMLICGGGTVNWSFLQEKLIDELSLLISPVADGNPNSVTVFEKLPFLPEVKPQEFHLKDVEKLKGNGVRLIYTLKGDNLK